jgi:CubicO group peptidase (beta-lactamase class C family)
MHQKRLHNCFVTINGGTSMLRSILAFLAIAATCYAQDVSRMDQVVQSYVSGGQFMGSVLVARDKEVLFSKGYGSANLEWNIPNGSSTKFRLGSITKQFTAAAILLLEEQGKLKVEDPIRKYLSGAPATWEKITIFHVLTHTSGIPSITNSPEYPKIEPFPMTPAENLAKVSDKPLEFNPGEKFNYSNSGYILLGCLIEKVSGQSYQEFIQKHIFTPLGMTDSGYDSNSEIIPHRASGYSPGGKGPVNAGFVHMSIPFSAGALYSTTEDLLRWESGLFGGKLLSAASLAKMTMPFQNNYALGLSVADNKGRKVIGHGGGIEGFNTYLAYYPDTRITIVVLGNLNGSAPEQIAGALGSLAHGEALVLPTERKEISVDPKILEQYIGAYRLQPGGYATITLEGRQLFGQITGQQKIPVFAESETSFFLKVVDATIEFVRDEKGAITQLVLNQGGYQIKAPRVGANRTDANKFDGTWTGTVKGPDGNPMEVIYIFEGMGETLIGTVSTRLGGGPFSEGKIEGNNISFAVRTDQYTINTSGTLSDDVINISQKNGNDITRFAVKRIK